MDAYSISIVIFLIVATIAIFGSVIATVLVYMDYNKMKREYEKEIEHLKEERNVCRSILKKRSTPDGS